MGVNNINIMVSTGNPYTDPTIGPIPNYANAAALVQARFNTASNAFTAAGITVTPPPNFNPPNAQYGTTPGMTVQIPPTPGVIGWNVTTQTIRQGLDWRGSPTGGASPAPGSQPTTNFAPNNFNGTSAPQGGVLWQPNPLPQIQRSNVWEPLLKIR